MMKPKNNKKTKTKKNTVNKILLGLVLVILAAGSLYFAHAAPEGATISSSSVDTGPSKSPGSRTDDGGEIITLELDLEQQTDAWKAYVGNVTGKYVLESSNNFSIYEWPSGANIDGEVYISRSDSVNFTSGAVTCATPTEITTEDTALGLDSSKTYSINQTFNVTAHSPFDAGSGNSFAENDCYSIALWVNDTSQAAGSSALFQEVALHDGANLVYASIINDDQTGFDNTTSYDFQAIIAENESSSGTTYYFYVELGS